MRYTILLYFIVSTASAFLYADSDSMKKLIKTEHDRQFRDYTANQQGSKPTVITTADDAAGGCDGIINGRYGFHVASSEEDPWWQVDLGKPFQLGRIVIHNRTDSGCAPRTKNIKVQVLNSDDEFETVYQHGGTVFYGGQKSLAVDLAGKDVQARIVRLAVDGKCSFALDEIEVYSEDKPGENIALGKPADQKSTSQYSSVSLAVRKRDNLLKEYTLKIADSGLSLADRLALQGADPNEIDKLSEQLIKIKDQLNSSESIADQKECYYLAQLLKRKITFLNPLLDFDKIMFIKRHDAKGVFHMCDQYYGFNGVRGGGLFVLHNPFSDNPELIDLTENAVVKNGRLQGKSLKGGVFLSPELSYDGRKVLFAWCSGTGQDLQWTDDSCYHIFSIDSDGSNLKQLTDGPWNDFDPCFLPGGRIVFISERRGGYLRCGRHCPVYTMFSMEPDGSDIVCLSYHETHEWHPSVDNHGMLVYTRWDYVDRDTNVAHHIWTCFPDGRDPRSLHGNYPVRRESRPWMEMDIRAIPDSEKYIATAAAHHGHAFGSLVMIDQQKKDDRAMSQLTRLTPEVPFPEAERNLKPVAECMVYATPWPLSEDDYLCAYGADAKNHGIYLVDRFGNRQLIYRDPEIASISPVPLRPSPVPPVIPSRTTQTQKALAESHQNPGKETIAIVNIYDSDFDWPGDVKVSALRIIQLLPKTTAPPNEPRIGIANQSNARAVLGTVPIEADGSAYFRAPAGKAIYFQALDNRGMAIQSMRSVTYVHPGEQMTCLGCHEDKHKAPMRSNAETLALKRSPSEITPDVEGSNPFNYVRLVQPVLDKNCVGCHKEKDAFDLTGVIEGGYGWSRSYSNLSGKYGFYFNVSNGSINEKIHGGARTIPGKFGAKASQLLKYLQEDHCGVKLSNEEFHRITLWLDCNSEFYGSYENTIAQSKGHIIYPALE